jgi:hypothetical protein
LSPASEVAAAELTVLKGAVQRASLAARNPGYGSVAGGDDREQEDEHDEPSLGSSNDYCGTGADYDHGAFGVDIEGPDDDKEPSLCGLGRHAEPSGFGNSHDGELEIYPHQKDTTAARDRFYRNRSNVRWADLSRVDVASIRKRRTTAAVE